MDPPPGSALSWYGCFPLYVPITLAVPGLQAGAGEIIPGEAVWLSGHIGVYIGGGKVIECSPAFLNRVQVTACLNIGKIAGMNGRKWTKHGRLPYITYDMTEAFISPVPFPSAGLPAPPVSFDPPDAPGRPAGAVALPAPS